MCNTRPVAAPGLSRTVDFAIFAKTRIVRVLGNGNHERFKRSHQMHAKIGRGAMAIVLWLLAASSANAQWPVDKRRFAATAKSM